MSEQISEAAIIRAALKNDHDGCITVNTNGDYCVGDFIKVSREQALAAQAEIDRESEVTDEMVDAGFEIAFGVKFDPLKRFQVEDREAVKKIIEAVFKARAKRGGA